MPAMVARRLGVESWTGAHVTMVTAAPILGKQVVALFNANDDTVEIVQRMLSAADFECLVAVASRT